MPSHWWIILTVVSVESNLLHHSPFCIFFWRSVRFVIQKSAFLMLLNSMWNWPKERKYLLWNYFTILTKNRENVVKCYSFSLLHFLHHCVISHDCWQCCIFVNSRLPKIRVENITSPMPGLVFLTAGLPILYYKIPDGLVRKKFCLVIFV